MTQLSNKNCLRAALLSTLLLAVAPAFAHPGHAVAMSFGSGFSHPLLGLDHVLAMLAVGLWAAQNKRPALWLLPVLFPLVLLAGAAIGAGIGAQAGIEIGIAASVAMLGLLIAGAVKLPVWASAFLVSVFAVFHGFAHGVELPQTASAVWYGAGFVLATGLLHVAGMSISLIHRKNLTAVLTRVAGAVIATAGVYFLAAA